MGILDAILMFSKGREATCPRVPLQGGKRAVLAGCLKPSLLKHNEVLCKEIKRPSIHFLWGPREVLFHAGLLGSTIHNQKEMWVARKRKEAMAKIPKLACVLFKYIYF